MEPGQADRYPKHVAVNPETGCWEWTASLFKDGYGQQRVKGEKEARAHRRAWIARNGPIPPGALVLHRCDVRRCVNPDHLFLGDHAENMADMKAKGRCGKQTPTGPRLSPAHAQAIRFLRASTTLSRNAIAAMFGIDPHTVTQIASRRRWASVPDLAFGGA